jgi:outer membrane protein assembly factor BamB
MPVSGARRTRLGWCTIIALLLATLSADAGSFDWPQWQGPDRNALCKEIGLLQKWPSNGPPLLWTATGLGEGYSTPSIANGRVFTMGNIKSQECVLALDENDQGKLLWSTPVGPVRADGGGYPGPRSTPTVDGDLLYALGINGDLVCLEAATGKLRWRKDLVKDYGGHMMSTWGYSESPLVDGEKLVCTPGGRGATLVALDKLTGTEIWKAAVPEGDRAAYSSIVIAEVDGLRQYVQLVGKGVVGIDARNGRFLWRYDRVANKVANIATPIVRGNLVFCSTSYKAGSALLRLTRHGEDIQMEPVYFLPGTVLQNHHGGLVLVDNYIYGGHGQNAGAPECINLQTGKLMWKKDHGPGDGSAAVLYADGKIYMRYQNGILALIEASPAAYHEISKFHLPHNSGKPSWPHPVIANGKLYIRDQDSLMCFDIKAH